MPETLLLLAMGSANGLVHALDADHVVAVSTLAGRGKFGRAVLLRTALHWALGHGVALTLIVLAVLFLGLVLPPWLGGAAELVVGAMLLLVGLAVLRRFVRTGARVSLHRHGGAPGHMHLHSGRHLAVANCPAPLPVSGDGAPGDHRPLLIGFVHGAAGSGPLLAVLPLMVHKHFLVAIVFILVFSLSVALMMCIFGGLLGLLVARLQRRWLQISHYLQLMFGLMSVFLGIFWIVLSFHVGAN